MTELFSDPVFQRAVAEIETLGGRVTAQAGPELQAYVVVGGRSNPRWWLIPLTNRHVAVSGMAMFQPILPSARLIKRLAIGANRIGLSTLWARNRIYLSRPIILFELLGQDDLQFAYFTGTESPHRKVAVQVMDSQGRIKGFAKISQKTAVRALLDHEARTLSRLATLALHAAHVPTLLYAGERNGAGLLLTDTLKTPRAVTVTILKSVHTAFLHELAEKTAVPQDGRTVDALKRRYLQVADKLTGEWRQRFDQGLSRLEAVSQQLLPATLTHGDFTPWNTFLVNGKLYVFDWEYAETDYPASNDLIHFLLATPGFRKQQPAKQIRQLANHVMSVYGLNTASTTDHLVVYLLNHTLRFVERLLDTGLDPIKDWEGATKDAALIDVAFTLREER